MTNDSTAPNNKYGGIETENKVLLTCLHGIFLNFKNFLTKVGAPIIAMYLILPPPHNPRLQLLGDRWTNQCVPYVQTNMVML